MAIGGSSGGDRDAGNKAMEMVRALKETNSLLGRILKAMERQREDARGMQAKQADQRSRGEGSGGQVQGIIGQLRQMFGGGGGGRRGGGGGDAGQQQPRQGGLTAGLIGAGSAVAQAALSPQMTTREREYMATRGVATEGAAQGAMAMANAAGASEAMQMRVGEAAGQAAGSAVDAAFHPVMQKTQEARGGFADLRQMAAAGIDVSDEMVAQRAQTTYEAADRGYEFDNRVTSALSAMQTNSSGGSGAQTFFSGAFGGENDGIKSEVKRLQDAMRTFNEEIEKGASSLRSRNDDAYRATGV